MSAGSVAVADSWAVIALLQGEEPAATLMRRLLRRARSGNVRLLVTTVNLGEVYYRAMQERDEAFAEARLRQVRELPIEWVTPREELTFEAARVKGRHPLSYADAYAVALARLFEATLYSGDPEITGLPRSVVRVQPLDRSKSAGRR